MTHRAKLLSSVAFALTLVSAAPLFGNTWGIGASPAQAQTVSQINVSGNVRVDDATVISYLTVRPGEQVTAQDIASSTQALQSSGLFGAVNVSMSGNVLSVEVSERTSVASIGFEGNDRFTDDQLMAMVNVANQGVYTQEGVSTDVQTIQAAYDQAGYTNVTVTSRVEATDDGRSRVIFDINEGDRAGVAAINFTGNNAVSAGQLKAAIRTKESNVLSWLFRDDVYDQDRLSVDRELIRLYYANHGYPDARVLSAVAEFDAERNAYFINFTIDEGEQYNFGDIAIETSIPGIDVGALRGAIETDEGDRYAVRDLEESQQDLALRATRQGFAFAEVRPRIDRDVANKRFNITYLVDEGPRVYVERINIVGNDKTRDYVIRREFDFSEGDPFNRSLVTRGRQAIQDLGFFQTVEVTAEAGSEADQVVLNVAVTERSTGTYGLTGGYSTSEGILGEISLTERNFLGRGQYVRVAVGASETGRTYDFSFTEPRFMGLDVSAGIDLYRRQITEDSRYTYGIDTTGGRLRFGLPVLEDVTLTSFVGYEEKSFTDEDGDAPAYIGDDEMLQKLELGYEIEYSGVDNAQQPNEGLVASLSQEYVGLDHNLVKTEARARYFHPLWEERDVIGSVRAQGGVINDLSGDGVHPTEAFNLGPSLVRGFQPGGMGSRSLRTDDPFGSLAYAGISAEVDFPMPVLPETWGIRGAVWGDVGWIDGTPDTEGEAGTGIVDPLKSSVGASIIWDSPFGPLRGDFAHVIDQSPQDETQVFQLSLQTLF